MLFLGNDPKYDYCYPIVLDITISSTYIMGKRKLSKRQTERIKQTQRSRITRADLKETAPLADESSERLSETLGPEQMGLLVANYGASADIEDPERNIYRCKLRQNLGNLVVGDRVIWRAETSPSTSKTKQKTGVIVAIQTRQSELMRPDPMGQLKPIAANIDQMVLVIAPLPTPSEYLIDRYLVAAETLHIPSLIFINKMDLLSAREQQDILDRFSVYQHIGYPLHAGSAQTAHGLDDLQSQLTHKTNALVGQSGVGKSRLIKRLLPEAKLDIGAISPTSGLGTHTTTTTRLYHIPSGGDLIDSPGVREFGLWHSSAHEIAQGFIEFGEFLGTCKFKNCQHQHEPGCALRKAVDSGKISELRLKSFLRLIAGLKSS